MTHSNHPLLTVQALVARYPGRPDIVMGSFAVNRGTIAVVRGPSGSGKSTLLHLLAGITPVFGTTLGSPVGQLCGTGTITIDDQAVHDSNVSARDALRPSVVGWMPQRQIAISSLSVLDNVLLPVAMTRTLAAADRERAMTLLQCLAVDDLASRGPATLSVGQLARVCLARAAFAKPKLLLVDEPTAALDETSSGLVADQLRRCAQEGAAVIVASHDLQLREMLAAEECPSLHDIVLPR